MEQFFDSLYFVQVPNELMFMANLSGNWAIIIYGHPKINTQFYRYNDIVVKSIVSCTIPSTFPHYNFFHKIPIQVWKVDRSIKDALFEYSGDRLLNGQIIGTFYSHGNVKMLMSNKKNIIGRQYPKTIGLIKAISQRSMTLVL